MSKQIFLDEFHIAQTKTRIAFLELEIQKIKNGVTKASSQEVLNDVLSRYEKELAELKKQSNSIKFWMHKGNKNENKRFFLTLVGWTN